MQRHITILVLLLTLLLASIVQPAASATSLPENILPESGYPQTPAFALSSPEKIRFERLTSGDGLSHPYVRGITRDHLGFMWFATTNGLNLYDGYTFTVFRNQPGDRTTLDFDDLRLVYEDSDHTLWVGGAGGVDRMDRLSGEFSRLDEYGQVFCMLESQDGLLWVGFWHGLYAYNRGTGEIRYSFVSRPDSSLDPDTHLQGYVRAIAEDVQGDLWLGTDFGLYHLDRHANRFQRYMPDPDELASTGSNHVISILIDSHERIWAGTGQGLYLLNRETGDFSHYTFDRDETAGAGTDQVAAILEDGSGALWVGTNNGLVYFDPAVDQFTRFLHDPNDNSSLSDNIVFDLFKDPTGLIWVGTANGISIFNPRANQFNTIHYLDELLDVDTSQAERQIPKNLSEMGVEAILEDQQHNLWVGTMKDGLFSIPPGPGEIKAYQYESAQPGASQDNRVSAIYQDLHGTLWMGTGNGWLAR